MNLNSMSAVLSIDLTVCISYPDRKSTRLNSSHVRSSYAVLRLKKKTEAAAARSALESFLSGRRLMLANVSGSDRYRRITAEVFAAGEQVQGAMLQRGLLRVSPE